jgi:hypothetical protein
MAAKRPIDDEFCSLVRDFLTYDFFDTDAEAADVAELAAGSGFAALNRRQQRIWDERVLPIVSKPIEEQLAVRFIIRSGGLVPRKITTLEHWATHRVPENRAA